MIHSMTGFGRGEAIHEGVEATVELRSVNKRFTEISARLPRSLSQRESDIQAYLKDRFSRGRISVNIQVEQAETADLPIKVDQDKASAYVNLLNNLRSTTGLHEPVRLEHLLDFSDIFTSVEEEEAVAEEAWPAVEKALASAADALETMRAREGESLEAELKKRINEIRTAVEAVEAEAPERVVSARKKLRQRLDELFEDSRVKEDRLEAEIAMLADKLDVTEECVRLHSHLDQFEESIQANGPSGRKLKFLVQEIHREANTIGSKANDAEIAHHAVGMKEAIEKIREQVQNVE